MIGLLAVAAVVAAGCGQPTEEEITPVDRTTPETDPVAVMLAEAGPIAAAADVAEVTWQVEGCGGGPDGQVRLGVAILAGATGSSGGGGRDAEGRGAASDERWANAGWGPTVESGAVSATTADGVDVDLRAGADRAGLAVRGPCADAAVLTPSSPVDVLATAELAARDLLAGLDLPGPATTRTDQPLCGEGWRQTVVTTQVDVDDAVAAVDTVRAQLADRDAADGDLEAVDLATSTVAFRTVGGGLVVVTGAEGTLQARAHGPCRPTGT